MDSPFDGRPEWELDTIRQTLRDSKALGRPVSLADAPDSLMVRLQQRALKEGVPAGSYTPGFTPDEAAWWKNNVNPQTMAGAKQQAVAATSYEAPTSGYAPQRTAVATPPSSPAAPQFPTILDRILAPLSRAADTVGQAQALQQRGAMALHDVARQSVVNELTQPGHVLPDIAQSFGARLPVNTDTTPAPSDIIAQGVVGLMPNVPGIADRYFKQDRNGHPVGLKPWAQIKKTVGPLQMAGDLASFLPAAQGADFLINQGRITAAGERLLQAAINKTGQGINQALVREQARRLTQQRMAGYGATVPTEAEQAQRAASDLYDVYGRPVPRALGPGAPPAEAPTEVPSTPPQAPPKTPRAPKAKKPSVIPVTPAGDIATAPSTQMGQPEPIHPVQVPYLWNEEVPVEHLSDEQLHGSVQAMHDMAQEGVRQGIITPEMVESNPKLQVLEAEVARRQAPQQVSVETAQPAVSSTVPPSPPVEAPTGAQHDLDFSGAFGTMSGAMEDSFIRDAWDRLSHGKRLLFSDRPGSLEQRIQQAEDAGLIMNQEGIRQFVRNYYQTKAAGRSLPGEDAFGGRSIKQGDFTADLNAPVEAPAPAPVAEKPAAAPPESGIVPPSPMVTPKPEQFRGLPAHQLAQMYDQAQQAVDAAEDEATRQGHNVFDVSTPSPPELEAAYAHRDAIGKAWDEAARNDVLAKISPSDVVPRSAVEAAVAAIQKEGQVQQLWGKGVANPTLVTAATRRVYSILAQAMPTGTIAEDLRSDYDQAARVAENWKTSTYGANPAPILDKTHEIMKAILGIDEPAAEPRNANVPQEALPAPAPPVPHPVEKPSAPAEAPTIPSDRPYYIHHASGSFIEVKGRPVKIHGMESDDFFLHREVTEAQKGWVVTEGQTGQAIAHGKTADQAVLAAAEIVDRKGADWVREQITKKISISGNLSPRYAPVPPQEEKQQEQPPVEAPKAETAQGSPFTDYTPSQRVEVYSADARFPGSPMWRPGTVVGTEQRQIAVDVDGTAGTTYHTNTMNVRPLVREAASKAEPSSAGADPYNTTIRENAEQGEIEVKFASKPPLEVMTHLKSAGFRWNPAKQLWRAKNTSDLLTQAHQITGQTAPAVTPESGIVEPSAPVREETSHAPAETAAAPAPEVGPGIRSRGPLETVPPEPVRSSVEAGEARPGSAEGGEPDHGSGHGSGPGGSAVRPGVGEPSGRVGVSPGERGRAEPTITGPEPTPKPTTSAHSVETQQTAALDRHDYTITPEDYIGTGGDAAKIEGNIAAIETLQRIESEGRLATPDEQKILVKYVGWGGLAQKAFGYQAGAVRERLGKLLTEEEIRSASGSTLNAHYTSSEVIGAIWTGLEHLGIDSLSRPRVLEPSMGVGHFFGLMPPEIRSHSALSGVELDTLTGRIAAQLYQRAGVQVTGFEQARLPNHYFDLAISNVPFGDYGVMDKEFARSGRGFLTSRIHDYFFARALDKVRPGGVVAFITSKGTMDKQEPRIREYLRSKADLIGAVRLPDTAFKKNAGTSVTTDLILLMKRAEGESPSGPDWMRTVPYKNAETGDEMPINEYFYHRPQMMMGTMTLEGQMYRDKSPTLSPSEFTKDPEGLRRAVVDALKTLPAGTITKPVHATTEAPNVELIAPPPATVKENAYYTTTPDGGELYRNVEGTAKKIPYSADRIKKVAGLLKVRDAYRELLRAMATDETQAETEIVPARKKLNATYDEFTKRNGPLVAPGNLQLIEDDPDAALLASLEEPNRDTKAIEKAPVFKKRTVFVKKPPTSAGDADEALKIALNETGRVDLPRMSQLTGEAPEKLVEDLGEQLYHDPEGAHVTADEYLSGDVRQKLAVAKIAAAGDPDFKRNVEALQSIQPKDLTPEQISIRLGSPWVPPEDIQRFVKDLLSGQHDAVSVRYLEPLGLWMVQAPALERSATSTSTWGTRRANAVSLIEQALNRKQPAIYDTVDDRRILNRDETLAATDKQDQIKERFSAWVWEDAERGQRLARYYNDHFNNTVLRKYDGSLLSLPGASESVQLRPHQKDAIWRIVTSGNTLLAHEVGTGKTFVMIGAAMEMKRLGLARKSMIVVPNHIAQQVQKDVLKMYPAAKVLTPTDKDMEPAERQKMMARIASGDWDIVVTKYTHFENIQVHPDTERQFVQGQIDILTDFIAQARAERDAATVKEVEKEVKKLQVRLAKALARSKDPGITWEEMGIDALFVDEADSFKNLAFPTRQTRVKGVNAQGSGRSMDLLLKSRYLMGKNGGRTLVFATGTPISNSMVEMFTMMRYLQPAALTASGLEHFDAWSGTFGNITTGLEVGIEGKGYRPVSRMGFDNLPELVTQFRGTADVKRTSDPGLEDVFKLRPKLKGGANTVLAQPASPEYLAYVESLAAEAEAYRANPGGFSKATMLLITGRGRKAALDMRLVVPEATDDPSSKVNTLVAKVLENYKASNDRLGTQLVFSDLGVPNKEGRFDVYGDIRRKLIAGGIPKTEIAFMQDHKKDKESLFVKVNDGTVRVLLGSTETMGAGTNVQRRLVALYHLDVPWRPRDLEQREGRILRQGNENKEVSIYNLVTQGVKGTAGFDTVMWQKIESKSKMIQQALQADPTIRNMDDVNEEVTLSAAEIKAIASGDPRIQESVIVNATVDKLRRLADAHLAATRTALWNAQVNERALPGKERRLEELEAAEAALADLPEPFSMMVGKSTHKEKKPAGEAILTLLDKIPPSESTSALTRPLGRYGPFEMRGYATEDTRILTGENRSAAAIAAGIIAEKEPRRINHVMLSLPDGATVNTEVSADPVGAITRIENALKRIPSEAKMAAQSVREAKDFITTFRKDAISPYVRQADYEKALARKAELDRELEASDVTKEPQGGALSEDEDFDEDMGPEAGAVSLAAIGVLVDALKGSLDAAAQTVALASREGARPAANTLRSLNAHLVREQDQADIASRAATKIFKSKSHAEIATFITNMEAGIDNGPLEPLAQVLRRMLDSKRSEVQGLGVGALDTFIDNYFPHIWKDPGGLGKFIARARGKRPMEGSKAFLKQRTLDTFADGLAAGYEPVSWNPVDLVRLKLAEMDRFILAHRFMAIAKRNGWAKFFRGAQPPPDGWDKYDDRMFDVRYRNADNELVIAGSYYGPQNVVDLVNQFLAPGIRGKPIVRTWQASNNLMNQFQLGISAFHGAFTAKNAIASKFALGLNQLAEGQVKDSLKSFVEGSAPLVGMKVGATVGAALAGPVGGAVGGLIGAAAGPPIQYYRTGKKVAKEWFVPGSQGAQMQAIVRALEAGGGRARQDAFYVTNFTKRFAEAFDGISVQAPFSAKAGAVAKMGVFAAPTIVEQLARPIMEAYVPHVKLGAFHDMMTDEYARLNRLYPQGIPAPVLAHAAADIWDSIDNRFGQLVYDNAFWNKTMKDLGMLGFRSLGWRAGSTRELAGGVLDLGRMLPGRRGGAGAPPPPPGSSPGGVFGNKEPWQRTFSWRSSFAVFGLPLMAAMVGAIYIYIRHGRAPKDLDEALHPQNLLGETMETGTYMKEAEHLEQKGFLDWVWGGRAPFPSVLAELWKNADWRNTQVYDPNAPLLEKAKQIAGHVATENLPISVQRFGQMQQQGGDLRDMILQQFGGVTKAPSYVTLSPLQKFIRQQIGEDLPGGTRTKEEAALSDIRRRLKEEERAGQNVGSVMSGLVHARVLTDQQRKAIRGAKRFTPEQDAFRKLSPGDMLQGLGMASPEEWKDLRIIALKSLHGRSHRGAGPDFLRGVPAETKGKLWQTLRSDTPDPSVFSQIERDQRETDQRKQQAIDKADRALSGLR